MPAATSAPAAVALALGLAALAACGEAAPAAPRRPSVLLIVVDTLRADRLSCYGYERETSPHLDRLAAEGVRYARAISQAPWTTPSIGSLMTSRFPSELGILHERSVLSPDEVTLAEALSLGGYRTAGVVSHSFCSSEWNFDQGFERFDESNVLGHDAVTSEAVTRRALELLDGLIEADAGAPFLLFAHYFDPHFAYVDHPEFPFPGPEDYGGPVTSGMKYSLLRDMSATVDEADLAQVRRFYDSEIALTDRWIGALLEGLRERGLWDETLVVVTADHGEEFNDHGRMGHSRTVYQELVHVPLIVKYPRGEGWPSGAVEPRTVALLDVYPTVLEVTGVELPPALAERLAGVSLLGDGARERPVVSETARRGGVRGVVDPPYKLVHLVADDAFELYDLDADPGERRDLLAARPELAARLKQSLADWERSVRDGAAAERDLDPELIERLEAMGYLGGDDE